MSFDKNITDDAVETADAGEIGFRANAPLDWTVEPHMVEAALNELRGLSREYHVIFFTSAGGVVFDDGGFV